MPTKDAPRRAVANISAAVFFRSRRYPKLTAIAIVPLLLMRTKVMIAIRISGIDWPAIVSANTSLAFGHGTVVDDRSEEHTSELQSLMRISYAVFCLKKKTNLTPNHKSTTK